MCHFSAEKLAAPTVRGVPRCEKQTREGRKQGGGGVAPGGGGHHLPGAWIQQQIGAHCCLQVIRLPQNHFNKVLQISCLTFSYRCVMAVLEEEECLNKTSSSTESTSASSSTESTSPASSTGSSSAASSTESTSTGATSAKTDPSRSP